MPSFWLPPNTESNGLTAERWAHLITVNPGHADTLLSAFRAAGVAARCGPEHPSDPQHGSRIWVDVDRYADAENVLMREMLR